MRFELKPWDRNRLRLHPPLADCVVELNGKTFGLRACNGILFFRERSDQTKTWAIAAPLPEEIEGDLSKFEAHFRREYERGNVARYVLHFDSYVERVLPLFLQGDRTGFCREGWNRDDLLFTHSVSMHDLLEGADERLNEDLNDVEKQLQEQLSQLPFPDDTPWSEGEVEWLCGSQDELERVAGWICALEHTLWKASVEWVELSVAAENQFTRARVSNIETHNANRSEGVYLHIDADSVSDALVTWGGQNEADLSQRFWTLFDLALDGNTPTGVYWEYHDYGSNRTADEPYAPSLSFEFKRPSIEDLSTARVELKKWLAALVPASEVEAILNDDTPVQLGKQEW